MEPFRIPDPLRCLNGAYPKAKEILAAASSGGITSRNALARLWFSEGIPYAFSDCPAVFEVVRGWLAIRLDVDPKEISMTGSARIGSSLAPGKQGKRFSATSDLDLFVVSKKLFHQLRDEYNKWVYDFECEQVQPKPLERVYWKDNAARGTGILSRGFIDQKMIPNRDNYPIVQKISQGMWLLTEKLKLTPRAPKPKKSSIRCYKSWEHAIRQISLNLSDLA